MHSFPRIEQKKFREEILFVFDYYGRQREHVMNGAKVRSKLINHFAYSFTITIFLWFWCILHICKMGKTVQANRFDNKILGHF